MTIPLPGPPEDIKQVTNERKEIERKEGESNSLKNGGPRSRGTRTGNAKDHGLVHGTVRVDPPTDVSKTARRLKTTDSKEGRVSVGAIITQKKGREGVHEGHRLNKVIEVERSEPHVQIEAQGPDTMSSSEARPEILFKDPDLHGVQRAVGSVVMPYRRKKRKGFQSPNKSSRYRKVTSNKYVNNSFVVVSQNGSNTSGSAEIIFAKKNDEENSLNRTQEEDGFRDGPFESRRRNEESKRRGVGIGGKRKITHETQEDETKTTYDDLSNDRRENGHYNENKEKDIERFEKAEKKNISEETNSYVENHERSSHNLTRNTKAHGVSQRETLDLKLHKHEGINITIHSEAYIPRGSAAMGVFNDTAPRVTRPHSRSHTLRTPRRIHPRRHRKRNQKKPTRRKGLRRNNGTGAQNNKQNISNLSRRPPLQPFLPPAVPAGRQRIHPGSVRETLRFQTVNLFSTTGRTIYDHESRQSMNHLLNTQFLEKQRHGHSPSPSETIGEVSLTRRQNKRTREKGDTTLISDRQLTQRVEARVSEASENRTATEVVKNFSPNIAANESVENSHSEVDKRDEEGGEGDGGGGGMTSHPGREINEKGRKNARNMTADVKHDAKERSEMTNGKYKRRRKRKKERRKRIKVFRNERYQAKRSQHRNTLQNRENLTQKDSSSPVDFREQQKEDATYIGKTHSIEKSIIIGTAGKGMASHLAGFKEAEDSLVRDTNVDNRNYNSHSHDGRRSPRRANPTINGSRAGKRFGVTISGTYGRKKQFQLISRLNRMHPAKKYLSIQPESDKVSRDAMIHVSSPDAIDKYLKYSSEIFPEGHTRIQQRHYHSRHRHNRRLRQRRHNRHHRKENDRERSVREGKHNVLHSLSRLSPPGEDRKSAKWIKNDQRERRELADSLLAKDDWRVFLRKSYFETLFGEVNNQERWQHLKPLKNEAENFGLSFGSGKPAASPSGNKSKRSSEKILEKSSNFLRRLRNVSIVAQDTQAEMKTKRQNLRTALSQRCGRTGAGLLRSCGEPEMNCKPGKGDTRQAEIVNGSCDGYGLHANQSSSAEQQPPAEEDRSLRGNVKHNADTVLIMVSDNGREVGGGFQRRRRELGNLSKVPNVTYRCSPSHKYWLFASRWVRPLPEGEWTR